MGQGCRIRRVFIAFPLVARPILTPETGLKAERVEALAETWVGDSLVIGKNQQDVQSVDLTADQILRRKSAGVGSELTKAMVHAVGGQASEYQEGPANRTIRSPSDVAACVSASARRGENLHGRNRRAGRASLGCGQLGGARRQIGTGRAVLS